MWFWRRLGRKYLGLDVAVRLRRAGELLFSVKKSFQIGEVTLSEAGFDQRPP